MIKKIKFIELFAGIGGFRYGLEKSSHYEYARIGQKPKQKKCTQRRERAVDKRKALLRSGDGTASFRCVWANEWDKYACQIYRKNYGKGELHEGDITKVEASDIPDHDLLVGGWPCQAFSIVGKRRGFKDARGTLFFEIARIADAKRPMYMLLENVKGLISHENNKTIEIVLDILQELGYYVNWEIYNSKDYGVPQNRERIFLLCKHIKTLTSIGQSEKMTSCEETIQEWLFQLLLNNLPVVKERQELASKDWVIGWLILKEIVRNLNPSEESILAGTMIPMDGGLFQSKGEDVWQSIDTLLKKNWVEHFPGPSKCTTSTAIEGITDLKTYTYSQMLLAILTATVQLRSSSRGLWKEVLSNLIIIEENMNYARINNRTEKAIITETGIMHFTANLQDLTRYFIIGHIKGERRPEVFPVGESGQVSPAEDGRKSKKRQRISSTIDARYGALRNAGETYIVNKLNQVGQIGKDSESTRVYDPKGIARTIKNGGGLGSKTGLYSVGTKRGQDRVGRHVYSDKARIRRLTPTECERLQGFPDNWTKIGLVKKATSRHGVTGKIIKCIEETISDSQRYKCLGNAVTTNVITAIGEKLLKSVNNNEKKGD